MSIEAVILILVCFNTIVSIKVIYDLYDHNERLEQKIKELKMMLKDKIVLRESHKTRD